MGTSNISISLVQVQPNLHPKKQSQQLDFLIGDFLQIDWSDADIVFTNATCFRDPVFQKFEEMASKVLKTGAIVISVARPFSNLESWKLLEIRERQMSWAPALVYVYRKQGADHSELDRASNSTVSESEASQLGPEEASNTEDEASDEAQANTERKIGTCDKGN